jgi:hypothetical protein
MKRLVSLVLIISLLSTCTFATDGGLLIAQAVSGVNSEYSSMKVSTYEEAYELGIEKGKEEISFIKWCILGFVGWGVILPYTYPYQRQCPEYLTEGMSEENKIAFTKGYLKGKNIKRLKAGWIGLGVLVIGTILSGGGLGRLDSGN